MSLRSFRSLLRRAKSVAANLGVSLVLLMGPSAVLAPAFAQNAAPTNAYALVYSTTAAELFFTPVAGAPTHITHNGVPIVITNGHSYWLEGLDDSTEHRFELRASADGNLSGPVDDSAAAVISIFTGDFVPPVYRVEANNQTSSATAVDSAVVAPTSAPVLASTPQETASVDVVASACNVSSVSELINCVSQANNFDLINIRNDLTCSNGNCCPSGNALMDLRSVNNLTINGNGTRLTRTSGQRQCSLVDVVGGSNITLKNWTMDDDINSAGCQLEDRCPRMLHIRNAQSVVMDNVTVQNGKGYTIYVDQVNGFSFTNSRLINSGVLGLYIGHGNRPSTNVLVENSLFIDNQTNGLALLGVTGNSEGVNLVRNNRFFRNHRLGQFQVAPRFGSGFTGGGQVYLAQVTGATFENNIIRDGYCANCFVQNRARSGVTGLELGIPNRSTVNRVSVTGNTIVNHDGFGIHSNSNSRLGSNVVVDNNVLRSNTKGVSITGGQSSNNTEADTRWFQSFEGDNDLNQHFSVDSSCSGSAVRRQCGSTDARFGSCLAEVTTSNDCSSAPVRLSTAWHNVNVGQRIQASAWVSGTVGSWCLVFSNNGSTVSERCESLSQTQATTVNNLLGTPPLSEPVPIGASQVSAELRVTQGGVRVAIDDVKLSGF